MNTSNKDIRWHQRFSNYEKALNQLKEFTTKKNLSKLEEQGLIKAFEYTYELSWNTIKDFYEGQGETNIQGSKDAFRLYTAPIKKVEKLIRRLCTWDSKQ